MTLALRDYQEAALAAVDQAAGRGVIRQIVAMPTGAGKTVTFSHLIQRRGGRAIVLAHRDELVRQAAEKIHIVTGLRPGIVKAEEDEHRSQVIVASVQTLARPSRLQRLVGAPSLFDSPETFRTVVVDEVHHYVAGEDGNTFGRVLEGLGCLDPDGPLTVGFSATPEREKGELGGTWQEIVFSLGILDGIRQGWLCDVRAVQVKLKADFRKLKVRAGEFRDEEAAEMLLEADAPKHAAAAWLQNATGRRTLVFTPTIAVAHAMAAAFRASGVPAEAADGTMPIEQRRAIVQRLTTGETLVVPNAQLFTEGTDIPAVSCVVMAKPTRSRPAFIQMVGRGLRPYPAKADCLVLDLVGCAHRHDLMTVASLFDVDEKAAERGVLKATNEKAAARRRTDEEERQLLDDESPDGQLVSIPVELFKGREFAWVAAGSRFVLNLGGEGNLVLEAVGPDQFDVLQVKRENVAAPGARWPKWAERKQKLFAGLPLGYAQGAAEDYIRRSGAAALNAVDARWRTEPATEKQREILMRRRKWVEGMTKGEASAALTALYAGR